MSPRVRDAIGGELAESLVLLVTCTIVKTVCPNSIYSNRF